MEIQTEQMPAPEWASRCLKVATVATIVDEDRSTVYRKIDAGIYPPLIRIGGSARMPGWELWAVLSRRMAKRGECEAA